VATADFNRDGKPDIVWMNRVTRQVYVWFMDNGQVIGGDFIDVHNVSPTSRVAGAADFNGDGQPDLLWQDMASGTIFVIYLNGTTVMSGTTLAPASVSTSWVLRAVADYDRDGSPDLVWQNSVNGQLYLWYLNGTTLVRDGYLTPSQVGLAWQIVGGR